MIKKLKGTVIVDFSGEPMLVFDEPETLQGLRDSYVENISNLSRGDTIYFETTEPEKNSITKCEIEYRTEGRGEFF